MAYDVTIATVRDALQGVTLQVDSWFDKPESMRSFQPASGGWSINEVLEHISLTNHFLLLTCGKHVRIAVHRAERGDAVHDGESDLARMTSIGSRGSFTWVRPAHMQPSGQMAMVDIRSWLHQQWADCHEILQTICNGSGSLCTIRMTVQDLGRIDLYQWLYFVALHASRHVQQMDAIAAEYEAQ